MSSRDRRVQIALKWKYLDNLSVAEIRDRFEEEGIGSYTRSTIRDYLNEKPKEEVIEAIEKRHADIRLQAADRFERLYQEAREDLELAVEDEPVVAMVPKQDRHTGDGELRVSDWERVPPGDDRRPEWASERDIIIEFTDDVRYIEPGDEYPVGAERGRLPEYRKAMAGLQRDEPDPKKRAMARKEMAAHMHEKADVLGVYTTDINMNVDGELDTTVSLDEEAAATIREATLNDE